MDATLGFILIFVLAVVLVALGLGLSRRAKRADHVDRIPGERPPAGPVSPIPPSAPTATIPPVQAPSPEDAIADAGTAEPEAEQIVEAPPPLRERLGKTRAAFARLRGKGRISDDTWEDVEDTLLLADVGMPTTERILAGSTYWRSISPAGFPSPRMSGLTPVPAMRAMTSTISRTG